MLSVTTFTQLIFFITSSLLTGCKYSKKKEPTDHYILIVRNYPIYDSSATKKGAINDSIYIYERAGTFLYEFFSTDFIIDSVKIKNNSNYTRTYLLTKKNAEYGFFYDPLRPSKNKMYKADSLIRRQGDVIALPPLDSTFDVTYKYSKDSSSYFKIVTVNSKFVKGKDSIIYTYSSQMKDVIYNLSSTYDFNFHKGLKLTRMDMSFFLPDIKGEKNPEKSIGVVKMEKIKIGNKKHAVDSLFHLLEKMHKKAEAGSVLK